MTDDNFQLNTTNRWKIDTSSDAWPDNFINFKDGSSTSIHSYVTSATNADGTIDLFAIGRDSNVYTNRESAVGVNTWNGWYQLQGGTATSITATRTGDGRIDVAFMTNRINESHFRASLSVVGTVPSCSLLERASRDQSRLSPVATE